MAGLEWPMLDYRDKLALDPETAQALDGYQQAADPAPPENELQERAAINAAAAIAVGNVAAGGLLLSRSKRKV